MNRPKRRLTVEMLEDRLAPAVVAAADNYWVLPDVGSNASSVLANDTGSGLYVSHVNGNSADVGQPISITGGQVTVNANGTFSVTPAQYATFITFDYSTTDDTDSDTGTVSIFVNDPTPAILYAGYLADVAYADADYVSDVESAIATRDDDIVSARASAQSDADSLYADYQSAFAAAQQTYDTAVSSAESDYNSAVASADTDWDNARESALTAYNSAMTMAQDTYDDTMLTVDADYDSAIDMADSAYDSYVAPYQSARDAAYAYWQQNPEDSMAESDYYQAESDLASAVSSATAQRTSDYASAQSDWDTDEAAAAQTLASSQEFALSEYNSSLADADTAWEFDEGTAWSAYLTAKAAADAAFLDDEDTSWNLYQAYLASRASDLATTETGIGSQLAYNIAGARTIWQGLEGSRYSDYVSDHETLPGFPPLGERILNPPAVQDNGVVAFAGFQTGARLEPVLFVPDRITNARARLLHMQNRTNLFPVGFSLAAWINQGQAARDADGSFLSNSIQQGYEVGDSALASALIAELLQPTGGMMFLGTNVEERLRGVDGSGLNPNEVIGYRVNLYIPDPENAAIANRTWINVGIPTNEDRERYGCTTDGSLWYTVFEMAYRTINAGQTTTTVGNYTQPAATGANSLLAMRRAVSGVSGQTFDVANLTNFVLNQEMSREFAVRTVTTFATFDAAQQERATALRIEPNTCYAVVLYNPPGTLGLAFQVRSPHNAFRDPGQPPRFNLADFRLLFSSLTTSLAPA